jgi:DNA repair exonuclease SbcCD ATPase subunit
MNVAKGVMLMLVGVALGFAAAWLISRGSAADEGAEVAKPLDDLDRRLSRLERIISDVSVPSRTSTSLELDQLQEAVSRLQEQVDALTHASVSPDASTSPRLRARRPIEASLAHMDAGPWSSEVGIDVRQLEHVVTEVVASLAPKYLEEHVSQLYAVQKQADEAAQREAEQRQREEAQERRLAQLVSDLRTFVPGLSPLQAEETAQVIKEQWETMGTMRQQAWEQGTFITSGEILRRARKLTDERLYAILNPLQVEAFRVWRETRFGVPESDSGQ